MAGIGMLTLTGNNVAMDSYGPIADNAAGIGEMAWSGSHDATTENAQQIMADLDAVGNTTKAITKGVAIGSAVVAAVALFGSFLVDVSRAQASLGIPLEQQIQTIGIRVDLPRYLSACSSVAHYPGCSLHSQSMQFQGRARSSLKKPADSSNSVC
jgi:K(+)-stimulated pyrophosphate-energized sodium pump